MTKIKVTIEIKNGKIYLMDDDNTVGSYLLLENTFHELGDKKIKDVINVLPF